jgi:allantoate deiminase
MGDDWDAGGIMRRLDQLAMCTERPGEITRLFLTPAHRDAVCLVAGWMEEAGLATRLDAAGTLVGDLGVVMGIALAARLRGAGLPYLLEIRAFGDEEGVRFPVTLTGARAASGQFDPAWLEARDAEGVPLRQALEEFGLDPAALSAGLCTAKGAFAYFEIHIEQGPVLEAAGAPLGIVTAISGAARWEVTVTGRAGHAGTVPMEQRRDALVAAAGMVLAVQRIASARAGVVATVGRLAVSPATPNVIPGECVFSIDVRAPVDALREAAEREIFAAIARLADENRVSFTAKALHAAPAVACDARLQGLLADAVCAVGLPVLHVPSGTMRW